jgi:penicillin-binding protein 1A
MMEKIRQILSAIKRGWLRFWRWYKGLYQGTPWYTKTLAVAGSFVAFVLIYVVAVYFNLFWLFGKSPSIHSIMHPENSEASEIYSEDGVLIGKYFNENRSPVKYEDVNPMFYKTLIDTEDERFYHHHGVDFKGLFAAVKDMLRGNARGASTITQQLVKNMFRTRSQYSTGLLGKIPGVRMLIMKSKEWILAIGLEFFYDKQSILTMYVNTVDFGSNAYGIKTAAKTYFNTTPAKLKTEECAVLVGLLKATSSYNPKINPQRSLARRNVVLTNLKTHGDLTAEECDSLKNLPITLNYSVENIYDGKALYFRQELAKYLKEVFAKKGMDVDLYSDGMKIYTTLNSKMQEYAEKAVNKQMRVIQQRFKNHWGNEDPWQDENHHIVPHFIEDIAQRLPVYAYLQNKYNGDPDSINYYLNKPHEVTLFDYDGPVKKVMSTMDSIRYMVRFMHTGFMAMEPDTRHVKAWVGDIDFASWKYDKVTTPRQPGSTFKVFVYSEAMNQGLTPCDKRRDEYVGMQVYDKKKKKEVLWAPHNANGYFTGDSMTLRAAFAQSVNSIAVKTGMEVGIDNIIKTAHAMGIHSPLDNEPSLTLGSSDVTLMELVNAYATIVADGREREPILVTKVLDRDGNVIYSEDDDAPQATQALPYRTAFLMQQMLRAGLQEPGGTSMALWTYIRQFDRTTDFGGKTGTSNNHSDAWYVGVTPGLVGGAWVGGEYRCIHFRTGALGQGSRTALPIFGYFMESVLSDPQFKKYQQKFKKPTEDIPGSCYNCANYTRKAKVVVDSTANDSLSGEEILGTSTAADTTTHHHHQAKEKQKKEGGEDEIDLGF